MSIIVGGQIKGEHCRLFLVYSAGNFIEALAESPWFQIGESKYGKPVLDRMITPKSSLEEGVKCALVSMDSTMRSNLSVGLPLDLLCYEADQLAVTRFAMIDANNEYFRMIHDTWGERMKQIFQEIPDPQVGRLGFARRRVDRADAHGRQPVLDAVGSPTAAFVTPVRAPVPAQSRTARGSGARGRADARAESRSRFAVRVIRSGSDSARMTQRNEKRRTTRSAVFFSAPPQAASCVIACGAGWPVG